jgi:hypothetical protein
MTKAHGNQLNFMRSDEQVSLQPPEGAIMPEAREHWTEVLLDRIEQLEFTLSRETGIEGELLTAVGELGSQIDTLALRLDDGLKAYEASLLVRVEPDIGRLIIEQSDDNLPCQSDDGTASIQQPVVPETDFLHSTLLRLSDELHGIALRQDELARNLYNRIDLLEARIETSARSGDAPQRAPSTELVDQTILERLDGIEAKFVEGLAHVASKPLPSPDMTMHHRSISRLATAMKGFSDDHRIVLEQTTRRLGQVETLLADMHAPSPVSDRISALEERLLDRLDKGLGEILQKTAEAQNIPVWRDLSAEQRSDIARLMVALDGWSKHQEALHQSTSDRLDALLSRVEAPPPEHPASGTTPELLNKFSEEIQTSIGEGESRLRTMLQDLRTMIAEHGDQTESAPSQSELSAALMGFSHENNALHIETQHHIAALRDAVLSDPVDNHATTKPGVLSAAEALRQHLSEHSDHASASPDPKLEVLTRELRIAVAETLALAELHLN